jgi:hypothetical protein
MPGFTVRMPALDVSDVLSGQGCDPTSPAARRPHLCDAARRALDVGPGLAVPRLAAVEVPVAGVGARGVRLAGDRHLCGETPAGRLRGSASIMAAVATLGGALEAEVSRLFDRDPLAALALDGFATAALTRLVNEVCGRWRGLAHARRWRATPPLSPGMEGWPLADGQRDLFALVAASSIGVVLTGSSLMVPRKSVSFVVGLGEGVDDEGHPCEWCSMRERCRFRTGV